jgi:hypothetical protein
MLRSGLRLDPGFVASVSHGIAGSTESSRALVLLEAEGRYGPMFFSVNSLVARSLLTRARGPCRAGRWGLGELNVVVPDDLNTVAPRIAEIENRPWEQIHDCMGQRSPNSFLVVDKEAEVTSIVRTLVIAFLERNELVAEIDKHYVLALASQLEVEEPTIILDVASSAT